MHRFKPALYLLLLGVLALTAVQASAAQRATTQFSTSPPQNVSADNVDSLRPRVAQDPDGNVHVVWDSAENGNRVVRYAKGVWNGANYSFSGSTVVADAGSQQYATPSIAVAPNYTVMVAWSGSNGVYFKTWDGRGAPGGSPVFLGNGIQTSIAVDSTSNFHIVWNGDFKVQYCQFNGSECQNRDAFSQNASNRPDIAVDSNDGVHIVWDAGGILYRSRAANGGWGDIQRLDSGIAAQIAADGQGNVHLVWSRDYDIQYCRKTLDSGCQDRTTLSAGADLDPSIGATREGVVTVAYRDSASRQMFYAVRADGSWSPSQAVGGGPTAVDVASRPYVERDSFVWSLDYDIYLVTAAPGGQPAPQPPQVPAPQPPADARMFPETGQFISGRIRQYWEQNNGLAVFGLPLNAQQPRQTLDGTFTAQLFERNRLELHPEKQAPYDVLLGRLGGDILYKQGRPWETLPREQPKAGCQYFAETQHNVCAPFLSYWRSNGLDFGDPGVSARESLALFGMPLTTPAVETNPDGDTVLTQWFERARFEYHPNNPDPYKVLLGRLGAESGQQ